jgi:hypothetical protein
MPYITYSNLDGDLKVIKLANQARLDPESKAPCTHWAVERTVTTRRWFRQPTTATETVIVEVVPSTLPKLWPTSNVAPDWAVEAIEKHGVRIITEADEEVQQLLTSGNDIDKMRAAK